MRRKSPFSKKNGAFPSGFEPEGASYLFWGEREIDMPETHLYPPSKGTGGAVAQNETAPDPTAHGLFALPRTGRVARRADGNPEIMNLSRPETPSIALVYGCTGGDSGARGKEHSSMTCGR